MITGARAYYLAFAEGLQPAPPLWIDEWADSHMIIPDTTGASEPGQYRISRTPYARDIMRALSPEHPARIVVVQAASQMMKTQILLNWTCALIDGAPSNIIIMEPDDNLARRVAKRFDKTVQVIPRVREKVAQKKSRDDKNTATVKEFKGGTLWFLSGRSTSSLAEASARYVAADEVDRILREQKGEGDTLGLLFKRQASYGPKAKTYLISSPTEEDSSKIKEYFDQGNQHLYYVPCPHCGEYQTLEIERLYYDITAKIAHMVCEHHGCIIGEHHKPAMLSAGEWRATATGDGKTWSYQLGFLYAPLGWDSWFVLAEEYDVADAEYRKGNPEKMQVFVNTRLARVWSSAVARVAPEKIMAKAEDYRLGLVPTGAYVLTAAVDVQGNRLEVQINGWGPGTSGLEPWIINTHILFGDPTLPEVWAELDDILKTPVRTQTGQAIHISAVAIDSGDGDSTQEVYEFVHARRRRYLGGHLQYVMAIKGASKANKPIMATTPGRAEYTYKGKPAKDAAEIWSIGTDTAKDWLMNRLALPGSPVIHTSTDLPLEFYQQLMSETKRTERYKHKKRTFWATIKKNQRNEQWDLLVYNLAMAHYLGLHRYTAEKWAKLREKIAQIDLFNQSEPEKPPEHPPKIQPKPAESTHEIPIHPAKTHPINQSSNAKPHYKTPQKPRNFATNW